MLFNTFVFAVVFLPVALLGYFMLSKVSLRLSIVFLFVASVIFYLSWDVRYLPLLLGSIGVNFAIGQRIATVRAAQGERAAKPALILGLVFNLGLLGFFKYTDFLLSSVAALAGRPYEPYGIVLPIGISFFTFTQIAYLVDAYSGKVREYKPESYGLFVTYFPHLISGPILHHKDMMPQFDRAETHVFSRGRLAVGLVFVTIGLFKKVVMADGIARFVGPVFDVHHAGLTTLEAWCGALAYTMQLYFDFSAYCDMAYGVSYMFGIVLPINFNSPYKATSIIDFWRRWHITLSNFLRDYLYIQLGGNRRGPARRYVNLFITMLLGGLWHGAAWTFVVWGALHGLYLTINHLIRHLFGERGGAVRAALGWVATFLGVVIAWVFFRATSMDAALNVLHAMVVSTHVPPADLSPVGLDRIMPIGECLTWIAALGGVALLMPNAYQLIGQGLQVRREVLMGRTLGGALGGAMLFISVLLLAISETRGVSEFLYFNF